MNKKELISLFNEIEKDTLKMFVSPADQLGGACSKLTEKLNSFSKSLREYVSQMCQEESSDTVLVKTSKEALDRTAPKVLSIMQLLLRLTEADATDNREDIVDKVCLGEGEIALALRFLIKADPDLENPAHPMSDVVQKLQAISNHNDDFYAVTRFYQNTVWKYLPRISAPDVAIVVQGPVIAERDFTLETLCRYRWIYPSSPIILSTWEEDVTDELRWFASSINVLVLENKMPQDRGMVNIKLQLKNSLAGIEEAESFEGVRYVLKIRSDQRIFMPDFITYMRNMQKTFSVASDSLSERVIFFGGQQSSAVCPFELCDFMAFGSIEDVKRLYMLSGDHERLHPGGVDDPDYLLSRSVSLLEGSHIDNFRTVLSMEEEERRAFGRKIMKFYDPETYIARSFYENVILKRELTDSDDIHLHYWKFLKDCTIILDADQLMLYWYKYETKYSNVTNLTSTGGLTNSLWLDIYYSEEI